MRVLVLGGYGLIGAAVVRRLLADGHAVTGLGRSAARGRAMLPGATWIGAGLQTLTAPDAWHQHMQGIDAVVNASGVLQSGLGNNVSRAQQEAIIALIAACEASAVDVFVQISAPGATETSATEFYRTTGAADARLKSSSLRWTLFRPGLVLAPQAYGGTRLLRMLAAFPVVQPITLGDAQIQTVALDDVADAVAASVEGGFDGQDFDLIAADAHSLEALTLNIRAWLGFSPPRAVIRAPGWAGAIVARMADMAGWLGWKSALCATAFTVLADGVAGDGKSWKAASGRRMKSLQQTLDAIPATLQERMFARAALVFPLLVLTLGLFWIVSGLIGFWQDTAAIAVLPDWLPRWLAAGLVYGGGVVDIALGAAILTRPLTRLAAMASAAVASCYAISGAFLTPELWADPLGPMVKILPAIALALAVAALAEER